MANLVSRMSGSSHRTIESNFRQCSGERTVLAGLEEKEPRPERPAEESSEQSVQWIRGKINKRQVDENNEGILADCSSRYRRADRCRRDGTRRGWRKEHFVQTKKHCKNPDAGLKGYWGLLGAADASVSGVHPQVVRMSRCTGQVWTLHNGYGAVATDHQSLELFSRGDHLDSRLVSRGGWESGEAGDVAPFPRKICRPCSLWPE